MCHEAAVVLDRKKPKTLLIKITCLVDVNATCEHMCERSNMRFEKSFEQPNLSLTHNILSVSVILWSVFGNC